MDQQLVQKIKELREETGAPMGMCKEALEASGIDLEKAKEYIRKKGGNILKDKADKVAGCGIIEGYTHFNGKVGSLVVLHSQSDFVAKSPEFKSLAHELALQVAFMNPVYINSESIPEDLKTKKKDESRKEVESKPAEIQEKILEGKLQKWYEEVCLVEQGYFKDEKIKIKDLINETISKFKEKIEVQRFVRLSVNSGATEGVSQLGESAREHDSVA